MVINVNKDEENNKKNEIKDDKNNKSSKNKEKISIRTILKQYVKFYNENLKFKHIIITIIMLLLFFIMLNFTLNKFGDSVVQGQKSVTAQKSIYNMIIKEKAPLAAVIIFAGITPFAFLSVLGTIYSYILAFNLCKMYLVIKSTTVLVFGSISAVIQILGLGLAIATGIYYCIQSSKKFRYAQYVSFGVKDLKRTFYQMRKDDKKLKQWQEKEYIKAQKREKLNVKIPYINFVISFVITMIFLIIGALIEYII